MRRSNVILSINTLPECHPLCMRVESGLFNIDHDVVNGGTGVAAVVEVVGGSFGDGFPGSRSGDVDCSIDPGKWKANDVIKVAVKKL